MTEQQIAHERDQMFNKLRPKTFGVLIKSYYASSESVYRIYKENPSLFVTGVKVCIVTEAFTHPALRLRWYDQGSVLLQTVFVSIFKKSKYAIPLMKELDPELHYAYTLGLEHERIK